MQTASNSDLHRLKKDFKDFDGIFDMIGDNYFNLSQYNLAINYYNLSYLCDFSKSDYSLFKMATCLGIINENESKVWVLNRLLEDYSDAEYFDESMFELGITYMLLGNYDLSKDVFELIISDHSSSVYLFDAKLKLAISCKKTGNNELAIKQLKDIIENDNSPKAFKRDALEILKVIYESLYKVDDFIIYIESIPNYEFNKMELDSSAYYMAESEYIAKNYLTAERRFKHYLESFSNGLFFHESKYYLTKSLIELGKNNEAIEEIESILKQSNNQFKLKSIYLLADLYFQKGDFVLSKEKYNLLIEETSEIKYIKEANLRLLEIDFELRNYQNVIDLALSFQSSIALFGKEKVELKNWLAMSYFYTESWLLAIDSFKWIAQNSSGNDHAKSLYYISMSHFSMGDYGSSKNYIFQLANELPSYHYWVSRGVLLLAKNYFAEKDFFQANHVLEELILKYDDEELINEAKDLLKKIDYE